MKNSNSNLRFLLGLVVLIAGLSSVGIFPSNASKRSRTDVRPTQELRPPQAKEEKYIGKYMIYRNEPVLVTDVTLKGVQRQLNRKARAEHDWLNGLAFKVKNISNKDIVFIYISLMFPDTKYITGTLFASDLRYGADPRLDM